MLYGALLVAGIGTLLSYRDARSGILLLLCGPFLLYMLVPFSKFFSIRYAITALPVFTLLCGLGAARIADLAGRALANRRQPWSPSWSPSQISRAVLLTVVALLLMAQLSAYAVFRKTTARCSTLYLVASVLTRNNGFCQRHIVLNSASPTGQYMLRGATKGRE
jgi:hypothetical protein